MCQSVLSSLSLLTPPPFPSHTHTQLLYWSEVPPEAELVVFSFMLAVLHCERWTDGELTASSFFFFFLFSPAFRMKGEILNDE